MHSLVKNPLAAAQGAYNAPMHPCIGQDTVPIGDTVRALRQARGWTQIQLSQKAGVSQGQLSRVESGETLNPSQLTLARLAEALSVPLAQLIGRPSFPVTTPEVGRVPVPIVQVPAHAGHDWTWEPTGQVLSIDNTTAQGRDLQAIRVDGGCMSPALEQGDLVIFDRWSQQPKDGEMVVVSRDNQIHVRWARLGRLGLELLDNLGTPFPTKGTVLEGVVIERRQLRPRRRAWHDLDDDPR